MIARHRSNFVRNIEKKEKKTEEQNKRSKVFRAKLC